MRILNKKGFSLAEVLIIVVAVGALAGAGTVVYKNQQNDSKTSSNTQQITNFDECVAAGNPIAESYPEQCSANGQTFVNEVEEKNLENDFITVLPEDERVKLEKPSDVDNLPDVTPESFKSYIRSKLIANKPDNGCYSTYSVDRISAVNISGGVGQTDKDGEYCGGATMFWYLQDKQWKENPTQSMQSCEEIEQTTIYEEFIEICYSSNDKIISNPNGSIDDAL